MNYTEQEQEFAEYTNLKFKKVANWEADYIYMRVSEMILNEAEALAHKGDGAGAAQVLKELMSQRDPSWNMASVTVDDVYQQRRLELWGEGFSLFDHLRLKKVSIETMRDLIMTQVWLIQLMPAVGISCSSFL